MTELSFKSNLICVAAEGYPLTYPVPDYRLGAWLGEDLSPHLPARALPSPWAIIQSHTPYLSYIPLRIEGFGIQ